MNKKFFNPVICIFSFNNIFGKVGCNALEEVLFALIKTKCLPILFYGVEACPTNLSVRHVI